MIEGREVLISIRSDMGQGHDVIQKALWKLRPSLKFQQISAVYRAINLQTPSELPYLSAVMKARATLSPIELLKSLQKVEADLLPNRAAPTMKLGLLLYGYDVITVRELCLPNPDLHLRPDFLIPSAEVWPQYMHPILGVRLDQIAARPQGSEIAIEFYSQGGALLDFSVPAE